MMDKKTLIERVERHVESVMAKPRLTHEDYQTLTAEISRIEAAEAAERARIEGEERQSRWLGLLAEMQGRVGA
ncbi:MAG: hypothetical protein J6T26_04870 [Firmicutes bacterium]|nr:hypothetical protein [Bacillota bacterium]